VAGDGEEEDAEDVDAINCRADGEEDDEEDGAAVRVNGDEEAVNGDEVVEKMEDDGAAVPTADEEGRGMPILCR
jgi:hypothetical protein